MDGTGDEMKFGLSLRCRRMIIHCLWIALVFSGCARSPETKEARFIEQGKRFLQSKNYARAILEFKNAVQVKPTDAEPHYQLGLAYAAAGEPGGALVCFQKAAQLNPEHTGAQLRISAYLALSNDKAYLEDAQRRAQAIVDAQPSNTEALHTLAFAELRLGKSEDAVIHLQEALDKMPNDLNSSVLLMRLKADKGDRTGAEQVLRNAIASAPNSPEPLLALGRLYLAMGRMPAAEQQFRLALKINPKFGPALLDLGMSQIHSGKKEQAEQTFRQLAAFPDKAYRPVHAIFLLDQGNSDAAIAEFARLSNEAPADLAARNRLITSYLVAGRQPEAEKVLAAALKKNAKDGDALLQRSEIFISAGKYTEAQNDLNLVLRYHSDSGEAHALLARIHQARGAVLSQRQELSEALRLSPGSLSVRLELAHLLLVSQGATAALDVLDRAFESQKRTTSFLVLHNWAILALGRTEEARKGIDQGLAVARSPEFLLQDASVKIAQKKYSAARASLEETLKREPESVSALMALSRLYGIQGQDATGLQRVREYASQRPQSAPVQYYLGNLLLKHGNPADARKAYAAAKAANPALQEANLAMARLDITEGKYDDARQSLKSLLAAKPKDSGVWMHIGWLESNQKNNAQAIEAFRKVLDIDPKNVVAMNNMAYLLASYANQPDEALKYAQQAKELSPDEPGIDDTIGWVFYQKGVYRSAVSYLENALKGNGDPAIRYHLAMAYLKVGDKRGPETLKQALKAAPDLPEAQLAQRVLAETAKTAK
jgi:putative PEP-CTERM system TPR-repeat lipoprotein